VQLPDQPKTERSVIGRPLVLNFVLVDSRRLFASADSLRVGYFRSAWTLWFVSLEVIHGCQENKEEEKEEVR
jgi:hypothetical protein